jgi:hypothetical protein
VNEQKKADWEAKDAFLQRFQCLDQINGAIESLRKFESMRGNTAIVRGNWLLIIKAGETEISTEYEFRCLPDTVKP